MPGKFVVSLTHAKDDTDKATVAFVVANAAAYGRGWSFTPEAEMDDGWLDWHARRSRAPWRVLRAQLHAARRRSVVRPDVVGGRARRITLESSRPFRYQLDGEARGCRRRLDFELLPRRLRILVPPSP